MLSQELVRYPTAKAAASEKQVAEIRIFPAHESELLSKENHHFHVSLTIHISFKTKDYAQNFGYFWTYFCQEKVQKEIC